MAYCRFSDDSDVYVFADLDGWLECCRCDLTGDAGSFRTRDVRDMIRHLERHRAAGHKVPEKVFERLRAGDEP